MRTREKRHLKSVKNLQATTLQGAYDCLNCDVKKTLNVRTAGDLRISILEQVLSLK